MGIVVFLGFAALGVVAGVLWVRRKADKMGPEPRDSWGIEHVRHEKEQAYFRD